MHATTLRFSEDLWRLVEREAAAQGISAAQFVREATLLRAALLAGQRGDAADIIDVEAVASGWLRHGAGVRPPRTPLPSS